MVKRVVFEHKFLPYLLVFPQILITLIFFIWPASQAVWNSVLQEDPFGLSSEFVWFDNFVTIFEEAAYLQSLGVTVIFSLSVAVIALVSSLFLAVQADFIIRGATAYTTLLVWPYAIAPAVAGVLFMFLFNPTIGNIAFILRQFGYEWNHFLNGTEAMLLVVFAASWKQISYNFLFFLAGLQSIPGSLIEASAIDGANPTRRFWSIVFPLLSPTLFFLIVINVVYAFFDTFGIIHTVTKGGPAGATQTLVYKVFYDGFIGLDLGGSSAQSVILMLIVISLTVIQFRYMERKVHY